LLAVLLWGGELILRRGGADTLDEVKANGKLRCGVNGDAPGLSLLKSVVWSGLDVDFAVPLQLPLWRCEQGVFHSTQYRGALLCITQR
jgi:ABC-type amino acid transport substrate-binding protein